SLLCVSSFSRLHRPPLSTLFPYTTLFRSTYGFFPSAEGAFLHQQVGAHSSANRSRNSSGEYSVIPKVRKSFLFRVTIPSHLFDLAHVARRQSSKSFALA